MMFLKALQSLLKLGSLNFVIAATMLQSCFTLQLLASELELRPRVAIGYQSYRLEVDSNNRDYEAEYLFGGLGLSARHERFYVDFYGQTNLTEAEDEFQSSSDSIAKFESEIDRTEFNATLGYAMTPLVSAFGGFKSATIDIESDVVDIDDDDGFTVTGIQKEDITYYGPFLGASGSLPVASLNGSIGIHGTVSYLFGDLDTVNIIESELGSSIVIDAFTGQGLGGNVGLAWSGHLGGLASGLDRVGYTLGVDYSLLDFRSGGDTLYDEETIRTRAELSYRF